MVRSTISRPEPKKHNETRNLITARNLLLFEYEIGRGGGDELRSNGTDLVGVRQGSRSRRPIFF